MLGGDTISNEIEMENILKTRGWKIIYPENITIRDVLEELSTSEIILGIEGSAFHPMIFFKKINSTVYTLVRGKGDNINHEVICDEKHINYKRLNMPYIGQERLDTNFFVDFLNKTKDLSIFEEEFVNLLVKNNRDHYLKNLDERLNSISGDTSLMTKIYYRTCLFYSNHKRRALYQGCNSEL